MANWLDNGAAQCALIGDPVAAIRYSETGLALPARDFEKVTHELEWISLALGKLFSGEAEQFAAMAREIGISPDDVLALGPISLVWALAALGDFEPAIDLTDDMLARAEATGVPMQVAYAHSAYGRAFARADTTRALEHHRTAVRVARESKNRLFEAVFSRDLAGLEATDGDARTALDSLDHVIDTFHRTGDTYARAEIRATLDQLTDVE